MDIRKFCGEDESHQEVNDQFQPQAGMCWCNGASNLGEVVQNLVAEIKLTIRKEIDDACTRSIVPNLLSVQFPTSRASSLMVILATAHCRIWLSYLHQGGSDCNLRATYLIVHSIIYMMTKIEDQCTLFEVELLDEFGRRVEYDLESPVKIKIDVLNGDFDVEENLNWTQKEYKENIVKIRKQKGELLDGKFKMALSRGVASLGHLRLTDNSSRMTHKTFRLGATAESFLSGVVIEPAVSQEFRVKERRSKDQGKLKEPSAEDALYCFAGIAKKGPIYDTARKEGIFTVKDFLICLNIDAKKLKKILEVGEAQWNTIVKNAKACKLPDEVANDKLYVQISDQEHTERPYNIQTGQELELQPSGPPPRSSPLPHRGSGQIDIAEFWHSQIGNISHTDFDQCFISVSPTTIDQGPMYDPSTLGNGELNEVSIQEFLQEFMQNNSTQQGERGIVSEDSSHDHVTSKLLAACYVTKAAALFMVSVQQNSSAPKKKRKLQ